MQISLRSTSVAPIRRRSASACLRRGYLGTHAASNQVLQLCPASQDRTLCARTRALEDAVSKYLREAIQTAMGHPTLQTLTDAFGATDAVLRLTEQVARRSRHIGDVGLQVRIQVMLAGIRAGIADLESGLEAIQMLPTSAPDYPEED
jgi:hypothetical protein